MRFEEVVVFTCGLMKDPTALIHHIYKKFNEMNTRYLGLYRRVPDKEKETDLRRLGKTAVDLEFFHLVCSESRTHLPLAPLQNARFNWFDHERDDQQGRDRDRSFVYIPSQYYNFTNVKEPISFRFVKEQEKEVPCSLVIDNPHPDVVDSLLSACSVIYKHQSVVNLCLFNLNIKNHTVDNVFKLSHAAEFLVVENCVIPSNIMNSLQVSTCPTLKGIRLQNNTFEVPEKFGHSLSEAIAKWGIDAELKYLVILNCSLLPDHCSSVLQSLSTCKHLTYLCLSKNRVGNAGKHLARSIRNWGNNSPLQMLYLSNCGLQEEDCADLLQSLLGCCNLTELNLSENTIGKAARYLVESIRNWRIHPLLQTLYLQNCGLHEDDCAELLQSLLGCCNLMDLDLSGNMIGKTARHLAKSIRNWGVNPPLQNLYLKNCGLHEDDCTYLLQSLLGCYNITELSLSGNTIGKAARHLVESIRNCPSLQKLDLGNCGLLEEDCCALLQCLSGCRNIEALSLSGNTIGKATRHLVESIRNCPSLQKLDLGNCGLLEEDCCALLQCLSGCRNIEALSLSGNTIGKAAEHLVVSIRNWGVNPPLQKLYLENCELHEDDFADLLQSLLGCCNITELNLSGNTIGKATRHLVVSIRNWGVNPLLQKLYLENCELHEDNCADLLQSLLGCCNITELNLSGNTIGKATRHLVVSIRNWGVNPLLQGLYLENCGLHEDHNADLLQSLLGCCNITELNLSGNTIGKAARHLVVSIRNWGVNPLLQGLYLENCGLHEDHNADLFQSLLGCYNITKLNLSGNTIGKATRHLVVSIRNWGVNPPLQILYLENCGLHKDDCADLLQSLLGCCNLMDLDLSGNTIGKATKHLVESNRNWGVNPLLQGLYLRNCGLHEDDCAYLLQSLLGCYNITELFLSGNTIGKAARHLVESIRNCPSLQKLDLGNCGLLEEDCCALLQCLSGCRNIEALSLSGNTIGKAAEHLVESIRNWGINPPLQVLLLGNCGLQEDDSADLLQSLLVCHNLLEIDLSGNIVGKAVRHLLQVIQNCGRTQGIQKLYLRKCMNSELDWNELLRSLETCKTLTQIDLAHNTLGESILQLANSIRQWGDNPPLEQLTLYGCSIPEGACCELISALFNCKHLTHIELTGSHLCENGLHLKRYLETITDTLESLCLDGCSIPVAVMDQIVPILSRCRNLNHMSTPGNTMTGIFSNFVPHPPLGHLDLDDTALSKEDLNHLTDQFQKEKLPNLFELWLIGNSLDEIEDDLEKLLDSCIKHHLRRLNIFLCRNNLSQIFMETWRTKCKDTEITLDFQTDLDEYNANIFGH